MTDKKECCEGFIKIVEEKRTGDILTVDSRVIIPIIKIFIALCGKEKLNGGYFSIAPYAIIVVDSDGERIFSLSGEEIKMEDIINEIPELTGKIKEAKTV